MRLSVFTPLTLIVLALGTLLIEAAYVGTFANDMPATLTGISTKSTFGMRIRYTSDRSLYMGGYSNGAIGTSAVGNFDFFVRKFTYGSASPAWTKMFGSTGADYMNDMQVDSSGNVYAVGMCSGTVNSVLTKGSGDACYFKLNSAGTVQCSGQVGGTGVDMFNSVAVDERNGVFYAVGNTTSATFDGTSTVGLASGHWFKFKISDCTQQAKFVKSPQLSTQRYNFGGLLVSPTTNTTFVGFCYNSPVSSSGITFGSYTGSNYANGITLGAISVQPDATVNGLSSVAGTGNKDGCWICGMAMDSNENMYQAGTGIMIGTTQSSGSNYHAMFFVKYQKALTGVGAGSRYASGSISNFPRTFDVAVDEDNLAFYIVGSMTANFASPDTGSSWNTYSFSTPSSYIIACSTGASSPCSQSPLTSVAGGAVHGITVLRKGRFQAIGAAYSSFDGVSTTGTVDMFTFTGNFTWPPSSAPTARPTSYSPTLKPTLVPTALSEPPTVMPTSGQSDMPSVNPTLIPTVQPSTESPSANPTMFPSPIPTLSPTNNPTLTPSVSPTLTPTLNPSNNPTFIPTLTPTRSPTLNPTIEPSSANPTIQATGPSYDPTTMPTHNPTLDPTIQPSFQPTQDPTAPPSLLPTAGPTLKPTPSPTIDPSAAPTLAPTLDPTAMPSVAPSAVPSVSPTLAPSVVPTVAMTSLPTVDGQQAVTVAVVQVVTFLTESDYQSQQAAYNKTFQRTVSNSLPGTTPEQVTNIAVKATTTTTVTARRRLAAINPAVQLSYKVILWDASATPASVEEVLEAAAVSGTLDRDFRQIAVQNGITVPVGNVTFGTPSATSAAEENSSESRGLSGPIIAVLVVGLVLAVALILFCVFFVCGATIQKMDETTDEYRAAKSTQPSAAATTVVDIYSQSETV